MKKILINLINKYFEPIAENWQNKLTAAVGDKLSVPQIRTFIESSLKTLLDIINSSEYSSADQYLIDIYNLFSEADINLLEISQIFHQGRYSIINYLEKDDAYNYDPLVLLGFLDELIEQIYARYGLLHQEAQMKELTTDRDRLALKLEINQRYLKNILHSSDSAIMVIDFHEKIIEWNKGAERIFGYTENEVLGQPSSKLLPEGKKFENELEFIKEEVKKSGFINILETLRTTKDGKIINVQLNVSQLPSSNGSYTGRTVVIKDVTEVKKLRQQVDQSEKLAVIGQLAAGVAHEIGNPLASISSLVQILQRKTKEDFTIEQLALIKENIDRISKIVRELVDFSRPPSQNRSLILITDIIKTALGIVKYDKRVKKVQFITDLNPDLPLIELVPDQLLQVFVNILLNAIDAINGTGIIKVNSKLVDEMIFVEIIDDGEGIDENILERIFDPFFTTKEVGKGTGLGLSVSYGIIKQFKGDIAVKSKLNEGSTFTVTLPLK